MYLKSKYPQKLFDLDGVGKQLDLAQFSKEFFNNKTTVADVSVDSNSNVDDSSVIAYETELPKPFFRLNSYYLLWKYMRKLYGTEIANKVIEMQLTGDIYINDFHGFGTKPYCFNFNTYDVMLMGLPFVKKIDSKPPTHLSSFMGQLGQFITYASNSVLGAVGLSDLFIIMSYYVDKILQENKYKTEEYIWDNVKQELQSFIYTVNQPFRGGVQSAFTNVSIMDRKFLENLCPDYIFPNGKTANVNLVLKIQEVFVDLMNEELKRTPLTFPVTTACFATNDNNEIIDTEYLRIISEKNKEFAFMNIYAGKTSTISACCRLRNDANKEYFNSFGAGSSKIGSLGVVTINLPRIAIKSKTKEEFIEHLKDLVNISIKINNTKRHILKNRIEDGNLPLYKLGFMDLKKQYSTTGLVGIFEMLNFLNLNILEESGQNFLSGVLTTINNINEKFTKQYGFPHNIEQVPAENSSIKLSQKDKLFDYQNEIEFYSNQFIPLIYSADILDRIKIQGKFDSLMSGGAILHINVEEKINDSKMIENIISNTAKNGVIYFAICYNIQRCLNGHMSVGKNTLCNCGEKITDNFIRVVGFLVNTKSFHKVRRELDYPHRVFYKGV